MILKNDLLTAFEAIVESGTAHGAAVALGLTQTAITQRIKTLEKGLGLTLFLRSRKGMALTSEGKTLLQYAKASNELVSEYSARLSGLEAAATVMTLIGPTSALSTRVTDNLLPIYTKYPHLRLHLRSEDRSNRLDLLKNGEADLIIIPPDQVPLELDSKVLRPDRYVLVGPAAWKGRKLTDILSVERIIDFYEDDSTTGNYLKAFDLPLPRQARLFVNENEALIRMFKQGIGFGTLTEDIARPHLEDGALIPLNRGQSLEDPLALAWYPRPQRPRYFDDLVRMIK